MVTAIVYHELKDGEKWAKAHAKGGIRDQMFARLGVDKRTFRDPANIQYGGLLLEAPDMETLMAARDDEEVKKTIVEDGVIVETFRTLLEFTP